MMQISIAVLTEQSTMDFDTSYWRYCLLCEGKLEGRWLQQWSVTIYMQNVIRDMWKLIVT